MNKPSYGHRCPTDLGPASLNSSSAMVLFEWAPVQTWRAVISETVASPGMLAPRLQVFTAYLKNKGSSWFRLWREFMGQQRVTVRFAEYVRIAQQRLCGTKHIGHAG